MANKPIAGEAFAFTISLLSQTNGEILANPTLATGDVKVSTDGGALANLATLPAVTPAGSGIVEVNLTSAEVGSEHFTVAFIDAAGAEWKTIYYHEVISAAQGGGGSGSTSYVDGPIIGVVPDDATVLGTIIE
jgi:hypothetical protein